MRRTIVALLLAMTALAFGADQRAIDLRYVYRVRCQPIGENARISTGFRIQGRPGIVTALHGVVDGDEITAYVPGGITYTGLVIKKVDTKRDAALLSNPELEKEPTDGLTEGDFRALSTGSEVWVTSFPQDIEIHTRRLWIGFPAIAPLHGLFPAKKRKDLVKRDSPSGSIDAVQLMAILLSGDSGGPVRDDKGDVVAIANGGIENSDISWAIPLEAIQWSAPEENGTVLKFLRELGSAGLYAYQSNPGEKNDPEALKSALTAAVDLRDWIASNPQSFRAKVEQPRQLVRLYFEQLKDFKDKPKDPSIMAQVFTMGPQLRTFSNSLPYSFSYLSKLQNLTEQLDALTQADSLGANERMLLAGQLDQIQQIERNVLIVASVITNPEPNAIEDKRTPFEQSFVASEIDVLKANLDFLHQIAPRS